MEVPVGAVASIGCSYSEPKLRACAEHTGQLPGHGGWANALRVLLKTERERGPDFLRLANALSALYPKDSEEKRLLDTMLLALPR